jgi:hypothetical protein
LKAAGHFGRSLSSLEEIALFFRLRYARVMLVELDIVPILGARSDAWLPNGDSDHRITSDTPRAPKLRRYNCVNNVLKTEVLPSS